MKSFNLVNKKSEVVVEIRVNEETGSFRYYGKGKFGAGCGTGDINVAIERVMMGKSSRVKNSVQLVEA